MLLLTLADMVDLLKMIAWCRRQFSPSLCFGARLLQKKMACLRPCLFVDQEGIEAAEEEVTQVLQYVLLLPCLFGYA